MYKNLGGPSLKGKLVIFECDDWGSMGIPNLQTREELVKLGIEVDKNRFLFTDSLENPDDMEALYLVLNKFKDGFGKAPVFTLFCNTGNPDYGRIEMNGYQSYFSEHFSHAYSRLGYGSQMRVLWNQGLKEGLISAEYHGREHLSFIPWMKALQECQPMVKNGFKHRFYSVSQPNVPEFAHFYRPNFFIQSPNEIPALAESIVDGLNKFKSYFGFNPTVFNAPNGVYVNELNQELIKSGIGYSAVPYKRLEWDSFTKSYTPVQHKFAQIGNDSMGYYVRNCNFEPGDKSYESVQHVLDQIQGCFWAGKPAVISTHRVNFVGGLDQENRKKGLTELEKLLSMVVKKWPEVQFMSSAELVQKIRS